jgi:hypothetical protein
MSEKSKGFKFKSLFFRDIQPGKQDAQNQNATSDNSSVQTSYLTNQELSASDGLKGEQLVEDFVQRLQNLINQNNQTGFDFLEFTESLFEEKQNPTPELYKTVFRIAQKMDKTLTPSRLLDSALFYKDLIQQTADAEIQKGELKKKELQGEKNTEQNNLDGSLKSTRSKLQQLAKQIQELQNQEVALNNQLNAIDQKYQSRFIDIDRKISAIRNAKEQVLVSIVDIEAGIKTNLTE